jgi:hypothetical protein
MNRKPKTITKSRKLENKKHMGSINISVFGRLITVEKTHDGWAVFYPGADGKRRPAEDIVVPDFVADSELEDYLSDLCHEWASEKHPTVRRLE